jgi:putative membrane protein
MKALRFAPILFSLLLVVPFRDGNAQDAKRPPMFSSDLSGGDMQFLISATEQGQVQAELGELAATHAESADVKTFGLTLSKENAVQNEKIRLIAIKKGFALPENVSPQKSPAAAKLEKLQGLKFDKAYMQEMLLQEQNYVTIFERATQSHDPDIQSYASAALPVIMQHLAFLSHTTGNSTGNAAPRGTPVHFRVNVADPGASDGGAN